MCARQREGGDAHGRVPRGRATGGALVVPNSSSTILSTVPPSPILLDDELSHTARAVISAQQAGSGGQAGTHSSSRIVLDCAKPSASFSAPAAHSYALNAATCRVSMQAERGACCCRHALEHRQRWAACHRERQCRRAAIANLIV